MTTTADMLRSTVDLYEPATDLSLIYREIYSLATETLHVSRESADRLACWYCATGGHIDEPATQYAF